MMGWANSSEQQELVAAATAVGKVAQQQADKLMKREMSLTEKVILPCCRQVVITVTADSTHKTPLHYRISEITPETS
ncbi:MAG: hypothetical protein M1484_04780 [Patescibacteria group bacterium]|nr:hypothetical protein [Patescibacteria group bacterium]